MIGESRFGVIADVHGDHRLLGRTLESCRAMKVDRIILLGDLFDRVDQAETCAALLRDWAVSGVFGNHERDALRQNSALDRDLGPHARAVLRSLDTRFVIGDASFVHEEPIWQPRDPMLQVLGQKNNHTDIADARITFSGHSHHRSARDDRGPLDLSGGVLALSTQRRYLINPGATADGLFAVWDRSKSVVYFEHVS